MSARVACFTWVWICLCAAAVADDAWPRHAIDDSLRGADGVKLADVNHDGRQDIVTGWEESGVTRLYMHPGPDRVKFPWPAVTVGESPHVEDACAIDLDGDGALDVISMCEGATQSIIVHWGRHGGQTDRILNATNWRSQALGDPLPRVQWMFGVETPAEEKGPVVLNAGAKGQGASIGRIVLQSSPNGRHPNQMSLDWQPLARVGWIMSVVSLDMDGDGAQDVLYSDRRGPLRGVRWLENPQLNEGTTHPWRSHLIGGNDREVMFLTTGGLDQDGRRDILVAAKPASVLKFRPVTSQGDRWHMTEIPYPEGSGTAKAVALGDVDGDGQRDLVVTCEQAHDEKSGVWWLRSGAAAEAAERSWHDISGPEGTKYDLAELVDLDADGDLDVLTCEEAYRGRGLGVVWYENRTNEPRP